MTDLTLALALVWKMGWWCGFVPTVGMMILGESKVWKSCFSTKHGSVEKAFGVPAQQSGRRWSEMKVAEITGTDQQQIHIILMPENEAEKALVQILDQAEAKLSAGADVEGSTESKGLLIAADIKSHSSRTKVYAAGG